jgi:hypothetical protein
MDAVTITNRVTIPNNVATNTHYDFYIRMTALGGYI